ncbi:MAG: hypothetical protein ACJAUJ_000840 [Salibacteraceae bacterium]|jgi:hypothetical protein
MMFVIVKKHAHRHQEVLNTKLSSLLSREEPFIEWLKFNLLT